LYILDVLDWTYLDDSQDFFRVCFDATFGDDVPQELPLVDSEGAFFQVQLNIESPEIVEGFFQIRDEAATLSGFIRMSSM
jgi:hypothetical protein